MPPKLQIQIVRDGEITEVWTYIPEWDAWMTSEGNWKLSTTDLLGMSIPLTVQRAIDRIPKSPTDND